MDGNGALFGTLSGNTRDMYVSHNPLRRSGDAYIHTTVFTVSLSTFLKSMAVEGSRPCVSLVCEKKSVTIMFEKWQS